MARRRGRGSVHGILVLDKPSGLSSFRAVERARRALGAGKAGHTGTLDPLASGVLPICLGDATRIAGMLSAEEKEYLATVELGVRTDTFDREGRTLERRDASGVGREQVEAALAAFRGEIEQVPPAFSAVHTGGERAYERARRGEAVELEPRRVTVYELLLVDYQAPALQLRIRCSKGTYVRSIASDLGEALGCGAALSALRRTRSGAFDLGRSVTLERVESAERDKIELVSIDLALDRLPAVEIERAQLTRLRDGQVLPCASDDAELARVRCCGSLVALGEVVGGRLLPRRVFAGLIECTTAGS